MAAYEKARKRPRGSIDVRPSGALRVRVFAGYDSITGKRNYLVEHVPPGPDAEREAEAALVRLLNEVNERRNPRTKATLNQLLDKYLAVANLDPGTLRGYQRNYKNHVKPLLGSKKVAEIDAQLLDSFYAELRRCRKHCDGTKGIDHRTGKPHDCDERCKPHECKGLAASTVRRVHFLLSGALARAVKWGWITTGNPASTAEPPPEPNPDPQPPTPEQAALIVNEAWKDPEWGTLVWLAMTTGARRAELCALRWKHIDLALGTISVRRSVDQNGAETAEKDTKTHQHRRIALDPDTIAILTDHRQRWETRAASLGISLSDEAFVFSLAPDGSKSMKPDTVTQRYGRLVERLGITTTIHKLRHFSATELIAAGVDPRTVGGRLGHAGGGSTTLRVYSAWVAESDQRAANMLSTRMPSRPVAFDRIERAKTQPEALYEKIAAGIRKQILEGALAPGSPAPTQKEIRETHEVSAGTANRVVELLKEWKLVEATRGRRAAVRQPTVDDGLEPVPVAESTPPASGDGGGELLDLQLFCMGENVRAFTAEATPGDPAQLRRLLTNAARRHGGKDADLADYELEVRRAGAAELLTTFAAL